MKPQGLHTSWPPSPLRGAPCGSVLPLLGPRARPRSLAGLRPGRRDALRPQDPRSTRGTSLPTGRVCEAGMRWVGHPCPWPRERDGSHCGGRPARERNCFQSRAASVSMAARGAPSARAPADAPLPIRWPPSRVVLREKDFLQNLGFSPSGPPGREGHRPLVPVLVYSRSDSPASLKTVFRCLQPPLAAELVHSPIPTCLLTQLKKKKKISSVPKQSYKGDMQGTIYNKVCIPICKCLMPVDSKKC